MIRSKNKIYGEANHEETVISVGTLTAHRYVIFDNEKRLKIFSPGNKRIMITNSLGEADSFVYTNGFNAYVGTNGLGQLKFYEKTTLPVSPPANRTLVREVIGSAIPDGPASEVRVNLLPNYWYEIEVVGAGGGGGGGVFFMNYPYLSRGGKGGGGGYFKGIFSITKPTTAIIHAGNSGGGADGFIRRHAYGQVIQSGSNKGGIGGRHIPIVPDAKGDDGDGHYGGNMVDHDSSRGGNTCSSPEQGYDGGGGGGNNGPLGGRGGDFVGSPSYYRGSGGGAGGGLYGIGGDGADDIFPGGTRPGSKGLGGGGGGNGYISNALGAGHTSSGGGGGGGGATRVKIGTIYIDCGGGGGGAGGGDSGSYYEQYVVEDGENGQANDFAGPFQSDTTGVADNGGAGGLSKSDNLVPTVGQLFSCVGGNGGYGKVTIWRLE